MAHSMQGIDELAKLYFELASQPSHSRGAPPGKQQELAREIFSRKAQTPAELNEKARILLHIMQGGNTALQADKERFFISFLRDVISVYRDDRLCPAGSYGSEAAAGYYNMMLSGWH